MLASATSAADDQPAAGWQAWVAAHVPAVILIGLIAVAVLIVVGAVIYALRAARRHDAHLARRGVAGYARVVDVQRGNFKLNADRSWDLTLVWNNPTTGTDHRLQATVWRRRDIADAVTRAELLSAGELPVRVNPKAPEKYHSVDISSVRSPA